MKPLVVDRRAIAESAVKAVRVIPTFDPREQRLPRLFMGIEARAREQLAFERGKEALAHGVVEAVAHRAHRGAHAGLTATPAEGDRGVLGSFNRSSQHPEIRELQWQQQNMVAVDVEFVQR
jgi:hypothetical protein